jgi:endonuclease YncB( thermonuclease family)
MRRRLAAGVVLAAAAAGPVWAAEPQLAAPAMRNVTAPGMMPGPKVEGPLERVPVLPPAPPPPRWHRYFLPETTDAATFKTKDRTIRIAGVTPPAVDATCADPAGGTWPCGRTALYSLRMFLHGRAVECYFATGEAGDPLTVPCRVGRTDLARWLLSTGWAKPADGASDDDRQAAKSASCAGHGIWRGTARPADCPKG